MNDVSGTQASMAGAMSFGTGLPVEQCREYLGLFAKAPGSDSGGGMGSNPPNRQALQSSSSSVIWADPLFKAASEQLSIQYPSRKRTEELVAQLNSAADRLLSERDLYHFAVAHQLAGQLLTMQNDYRIASTRLKFALVGYAATRTGDLASARDAVNCLQFASTVSSLTFCLRNLGETGECVGPSDKALALLDHAHKGSGYDSCSAEFDKERYRLRSSHVALLLDRCDYSGALNQIDKLDQDWGKSAGELQYVSSIVLTAATQHLIGDERSAAQALDLAFELLRRPSSAIRVASSIDRMLELIQAEDRISEALDILGKAKAQLMLEGNSLQKAGLLGTESKLFAISGDYNSAIDCNLMAVGALMGREVGSIRELYPLVRHLLAVHPRDGYCRSAVLVLSTMSDSLCKAGDLANAKSVLDVASALAAEIEDFPVQLALGKARIQFLFKIGSQEEGLQLFDNLRSRSIALGFIEGARRLDQVRKAL